MTMQIHTRLLSSQSLHTVFWKIPHTAKWIVLHYVFLGHFHWLLFCVLRGIVEREQSEAALTCSALNSALLKAKSAESTVDFTFKLPDFQII